MSIPVELAKLETEIAYQEKLLQTYLCSAQVYAVIGTPKETKSYLALAHEALECLQKLYQKRVTIQFRLEEKEP